MKMQKSKLIAIALCGGLAVGAIGGAYSYFTSKSDSLSNNFSIVKSGGFRDDAYDKGEIDEPQWEEDDDDGLHENVQPRTVLNKDPYYVSTADYPGNIYMEVTVPTATSDDVANDYIEIAGEDVVVGTELIYLGETNGDYDGKTGWTLIGKEDIDGRRTYIYKYNDTLQPHTRTDLPVFNTFTIKDFNIYLSDQPLSIDIIGRIVQQEGVDAPETLVDYNKMFNITATNMKDGADVTTMSLRKMKQTVEDYSETAENDEDVDTSANNQDGVEILSEADDIDFIDNVNDNTGVESTEDEIQ